jgi:uroporphyrinogen III methyltransferase/synthase
MTKGKVYLIGAGPGDVKLITLKAVEAIQNADVVVYDRLANPRLLSFAKEDAEFIYVGKKSNQHTLTQDKINQLLVDKANQGKNVARLKGGDPFVFGRGGEEAEELLEDGIEFEIVPGITSAIAVPAYAGIPVTHRTATSSFKIITGHEDPEKDESQIDWDILGKDESTLIFLMGVSNLGNITGKLIEKGKSPDTPIALIQWGTRPEQRTVTGTLSTIVKIVKEEGITSPAIIIVGEVVKLREKLNWFEKKPFFGKRILVTRAREQASELSKKIESLGGEAFEFPAIKIAEVEDKTELDDSINNASSYNWLIFTSVNGVKYFFKRMKELNKDIRTLGDVKICAIGPVTKKSLEDKGLIVDYMPEKFVAEKVIEGLSPLLNHGDKILLPRADLARPVLVESMIQMGMNVNEVITYRTLPENRDQEELLEKLEEKMIHLITFTSSSTVTNFLKIFDNIDTRNRLLKGVKIACIGPVTAATAADNGLVPDMTADDYTIEGLIEVIKNNL